jgi:hypothetical protein
MTTTHILLSIIVVLVAVFVGAMIEHARQERKNLTQRVTELEEIVDKRKHTYPTLAGIEDATGVNVRLLLRYKAELDFITCQLEAQNQILGEIRQGPLAYDPDRPCGKK